MDTNKDGDSDVRREGLMALPTPSVRDFRENIEAISVREWLDNKMIIINKKAKVVKISKPRKRLKKLSLAKTVGSRDVLLRGAKIY